MSKLLPETTRKIDTDSGEVTAHYTNFIDTSIPNLAREIEKAVKEVFEITDAGIVNVKEKQYPSQPILSSVLWETGSIEFLEQKVDLDYMVKSVPYDHIPTFKEQWEGTEFDSDRPTIPDVVGATLCLIGATEAHSMLLPKGAPIFSEKYFEQSVELGLMLAFRDAHTHRAPLSPYRPPSLSEKELAISSAVENTLGRSLSEKELQALLLSTENKDVLLESASLQGKKQFVEDGVQAMEDFLRYAEDKEDNELPE